MSTEPTIPGRNSAAREKTLPACDSSERSRCSGGRNQAEMLFSSGLPATSNGGTPSCSPGTPFTLTGPERAVMQIVAGTELGWAGVVGIGSSASA